MFSKSFPFLSSTLTTDSFQYRHLETNRYYLSPLLVTSKFVPIKNSQVTTKRILSNFYKNFENIPKYIFFEFLDKGLKDPSIQKKSHNGRDSEIVVFLINSTTVYDGFTLHTHKEFWVLGCQFSSHTHFLGLDKNDYLIVWKGVCNHLIYLPPSPNPLWELPPSRVVGHSVSFVKNIDFLSEGPSSLGLFTHTSRWSFMVKVTMSVDRIGLRTVLGESR